MNLDISRDDCVAKRNNIEYTLMAPKEDVERIRDICTDIAHEHTIQREEQEKEKEKEIDIPR